MRCIENFRLAAVCKGAFERLLHECDDGHGADATGDGGDVGGALCCGFEIDIAVDDAIGCFGESAVDDDGSGFNPIAFDELGGSSGDDEEIGASDVLGQIGHSKVRTVEQLPQKTGKMYWCETPAPQGRALKNQNI